jgi:tetratricopeptide (TPR) repeat protein
MANLPAKKLHEQAVNLFRREEYEVALQKLNEALQNAENDTERTALIYNDMGVTYKQLENYPAAHNALDEAMTRFIQLNDEKGQAQTIGNRATVYEAEGEIEKAIEHYRESASRLEAVGENESAMYVWQAISRLRLSHKQYIEAIGAYEEGIQNMPEGSFKRKVLEKLMKIPGGMMGS